MSTPINHHYVSKFYLDQFSFIKKKRECKLFCFDKEHEKKVVPKSTKKICSEKHRNTIEILGEKEFFVETSLGELEGILSDIVHTLTGFYEEKRKLHVSRYWLYLNKQHYFIKFIGIQYKPYRKFCIWEEYRVIEYVYSLDNDRYKELPIPYQYRFEFLDLYIKNSVPIQEIKNDVNFNKIMSLYISLFYWRLPENDNMIFFTPKNKIASALMGLGLSDQASEVLDLGDSIMSIAEATIKKEDINTTFRNLIYPFVNAEMQKLTSKLNAYIVKVPDKIVSSDSPFILFGDSKDLSDGFIFVWSENYVLIFSKDTPKINDGTYFCKLISQYMFFNAKRYVYSNNKNHLESIVEMVDIDINSLKNEIVTLVQPKF
ncbi:DUF4238 domain-containing protein [Vibrio parahaemolyticus]